MHAAITFYDYWFQCPVWTTDPKSTVSNIVWRVTTHFWKMPCKVQIRSCTLLSLYTYSWLYSLLFICVTMISMKYLVPNVVEAEDSCCRGGIPCCTTAVVPDTDLSLSRPHQGDAWWSEWHISGLCNHIYHKCLKDACILIQSSN